MLTSRRASSGAVGARVRRRTTFHSTHTWMDWRSFGPAGRALHTTRARGRVRSGEGVLIPREYPYWSESSGRTHSNCSSRRPLSLLAAELDRFVLLGRYARRKGMNFGTEKAPA